MKLGETFLRIMSSMPPGALDGIVNGSMLLSEAEDVTPEDQSSGPKSPTAFG